MFASSDEFAELFSRCFLGSFNPTVVGVGLSALAEERLGMFAMFMSPARSGMDIGFNRGFN